MPVDPLPQQLQTALGTAYRLERELGGGGMSRVFVATDARLEREVVVKVLAPELAEGLSAERFAREVKLVAQLQAPHIVPVLADGVTADGLPYYTMPYVRGESLRARLARGAVPLAEAVAILRDAATALEYAHARGVVHRDIKPENLLLNGRTAVVTDFGIAKAVSASKTNAPGGTLTRVGTSLGTPAYMAPEQAAGDDVDHRADVYAWGVVAYELLGGRHPFAGKASAQQIIAAHIAEAPAPLGEVAPAVPASLAALVMRCLEKAPARRPQSSEAVLAALDGVGTPASLALPPSAPASGAGTSPRRGRRAALGVGVAALVALAAAAWLLLGRDRAGTAAAATDVAPSVAVLPFANLSGDPTADYLGEGLSEELIGALSRVERLKVAARTSSFAFKGRSDDAREVGRRLGVASVLSGSVRRSGGRLRVSTQLVSAATGFNLWSESYDREMTDVVAVQEEIARAIVGALRVRLGAGEQAALEARAPKSMQAYEDRLRGMRAMEQLTRANFDSAESYFRRAIAADPGYAPAWAGLAETNVFRAGYGYLPASEAARRARAAAERAVALDSTLAEAHASLGTVFCDLDLDFARGERALRRAVALNPGLASAQYRLANCIAPLGRADEAIRLAARAAALDPLNPVMYSTLGRAYLHARRFREGLEAIRPAPALAPDISYAHTVRANLLISLGDTAAGAREGQVASRLGGDSPQAAAGMAAVHALEHQGDSARALLRTVEGLAEPPSYYIAATHSLLGDRERALVWLGRAVADRDPQVRELPGPQWDHLRGDARYDALLRRLGVPVSLPRRP